MHEHSDIDLMVIQDQVETRRRDMARAYHALLGLEAPIDVLVYSHKEVEDYGDGIGHVINDALIDGRVVYDAA
ncbi:MAG: nucleotidyltransferase domain-containing protein [Actinomycetota bacterium]|nr:nucleotidyltransferase domain-containing protein [Actinomycetota bacterium]